MIFVVYSSCVCELDNICVLHVFIAQHLYEIHLKITLWKWCDLVMFLARAILMGLPECSPILYLSCWNCCIYIEQDKMHLAGL